MKRSLAPFPSSSPPVPFLWSNVCSQLRQLNYIQHTGDKLADASTGFASSPMLHVSSTELGKESGEADRSTASNAAEAQTMSTLEPLGGTLTLLGIVSYIGNTTQLPVYLRATWKYSHLQVNVTHSPSLFPGQPTACVAYKPPLTPG